MSLDVFTLWLEHGAQPKGESYRYVVVPKASAAEVAAYAASPPVQVLANTAALQAVRHDTLKASGVAFHQAGSVSLHPGLDVQGRLQHPPQPATRRLGPRGVQVDHRGV